MLPDSQTPWTLQKVLLVAGSIILAVLIWIYVSSPLVTSVTGVGEVSVPATNATVSFSVSANADSSQSAIAAVKSRAESLTNFLIGKGIAETDIAQGQVAAVPASLTTPGASGFQASITMAAKTVHVSTVSDLVSDLYSNGASVVSQPVLSVENKDELEKTAYNDAVKDAKRQAGSLAFSNWKIFRKIISISQSTSGSTSTATTKADTLTGEGDPAALENGVFKIVKAVTVTYKMW